jgi:hypothetical protein
MNIKGIRMIKSWYFPWFYGQSSFYKIGLFLACGHWTRTQGSVRKCWTWQKQGPRNQFDETVFQPKSFFGQIFISCDSGYNGFQFAASASYEVRQNVTLANLEVWQCHVNILSVAITLFNNFKLINLAFIILSLHHICRISSANLCLNTSSKQW